MSYIGPTLPQRVGPTMAQRASWRWANVICERWPNEAANQNTPLAQRCHAIWEGIRSLAPGFEFSKGKVILLDIFSDNIISPTYRNSMPGQVYFQNLRNLWDPCLIDSLTIWF